MGGGQILKVVNHPAFSFRPIGDPQLRPESSPQAAFVSYIARVIWVLFGRTISPNRSDKPNGAKMDSPDGVGRIPTAPAVVGNVVIACAVEA